MDHEGLGCMSEKQKPVVRELFIEELTEVQGGQGDCPKCVLEKIKDGWATTHACCEEGPHTCC
jgi:hypothetical protein